MIKLQVTFPLLVQKKNVMAPEISPIPPHQKISRQCVGVGPTLMVQKPLVETLFSRMESNILYFLKSWVSYILVRTELASNERPR